MSFAFYFNLYYSTKAMVSPGGYSQAVTLEISHALQPAGEPVTLNGTAPTGITVVFTPASPVMLPASGAVNVTLDLNAASTAAIGNDTITVKGVSGTNSQTSTFTLRVVQNLVVLTRSTFLPAKMNVTQGSTVFWQNFDGPAGQCNEGGAGTSAGQHNIIFTTLQGANSPTLNQFDIYQYTFNTPGSYFYYSGLDTDHLMNGTINVMASGAGGMGMVSKLPEFSSARGAEPPALSPIAMKQAALTMHPTREEVTPALGALGIAFSGLTILALGHAVFSGGKFDFATHLIALLIGFLAPRRRMWQLPKALSSVYPAQGGANRSGARHSHAGVSLPKVTGLGDRRASPMS